MAVYDTDENKDTKTLPSDDDLRSITGIPKTEEDGMDSSAKAGAKKDLADKESAASGAEKPSSPSGEESKVNSLYNPTAGGGGTKNKFRMSRKQGGGIAGAIIGLAIVWVGITTSGPLQFMHFSQLMQAFHFSDQSEESNGRASKLIRWMYTKDVTSTRMGVLAGIHANKIEARLNKNGFKTKYSASGNFLGYEFDAKTAKEGYFTGTDGEDAKKTEARLKEGLGASTVKPLGKGRFSIPADGLSNRQARKQLKSMYDVSNTNKGRILAAHEKRLLIKRANLGWNPLTRIDNKLNEKIAEKLKKINEARKARLTGKGVPPTVTAQAKPNDAGTTTPESSDAATQGQQEAEKAKNKGLTKAKLVAGGAAVVGLVCIIKSVSNNVDDTKQLNAIIPSMEAAAEVHAVAAKITAGDDVDLNAVGEYSKSLNSKEGGSWAGANSILYEQGKDKSGTTLPPELNPNPTDSQATEFFNSPGVKEITSAVCPIIENPLFAIITGVFSPLTSVTVGVAMSKIIPWIESLLSGDGPVDVSQPQYAGGPYGEIANVGGRLIANETAAAMGGRPLNNKEELALNAEVKNNDESDETRSIADRVFNPYKYDTPVAKVIDNINPNSVGDTVAQIPAAIVRMAFTPLKLLGGSAHAAEAKNPAEVYYGIPKVGYAPGLLDTVENPYENANKAYAILTGPNAGKYKDLLLKCNKITVEFVTVGTATNVLDFGTEGEIIKDYNKLDEACKKDDDPNLVSVRIAAFDTITMKALTCVDFDDEESCASISGTSESVAEETTAATVNAEGWTWPIKGPIKINSCFAQPLRKGPHPGLDIAANFVPAFAVYDGTVQGTPGGSYGILIIKHSSELYSVYEHMSKFTVTAGQQVKAGEQIGTTGNTAPADGSTGAHLHYGLTTDPGVIAYGDMGKGKLINPLVYLNGDKDYEQCSITPRKS